MCTKARGWQVYCQERVIILGEEMLADWQGDVLLMPRCAGMWSFKWARIGWNVAQARTPTTSDVMRYLHGPWSISAVHNDIAQLHLKISEQFQIHSPGAGTPGECAGCHCSMLPFSPRISAVEGPEIGYLPRAGTILLILNQLLRQRG